MLFEKSQILKKNILITNVLNKPMFQEKVIFRKNLFIDVKTQILSNVVSGLKIPLIYKLFN